jgi:hypothetical protein
MPGTTTYEFLAVSVPSHDAASLAPQLAERSADGWEVVAIVPTGGNVTAYCRRPADSSETAPVAEAPAETAPEAAPGWAVAATAEPFMPATAPEPAPAVVPAEAAPAPAPAAAPVGAEPVAAMAAAAPAVPAGWYSDPSARFELRYWDGVAWTEHVARNGQQYTDPPVA